MEDEGFDKLRKASMPDAIHDSSARYFPRGALRVLACWGWGSALAQACAERIGDGLGASFFFSRSNEQTDPNTFVPTIVYQLASKFAAYRQLVDAKIIRNLFVLGKSVDVQFREFLVKPLRELSSRGQQVSESLIIIDGLDECHGQDAQRVIIIKVTTTSILEQTTPSLWAFFGRLKPPIEAAFSGWVEEICGD